MPTRTLLTCGIIAGPLYVAVGLAQALTRDGFTGGFFFAAFAGIASGSHGPTTLAFVAAVLTVCAWLTTISVHFYRTVATNLPTTVNA
jgi:hypothetical protein